MRRGTVIVCPTAVGGHIEHAMNIALTLRDMDAGAVQVVSRPGARAYFKDHDLDQNDIINELLTAGKFLDRLLVRSRAGRIIRFVYENVVLNLWILRNRKAIAKILVEEPKYGFLPHLRRHCFLALVLHNVDEHDLDSGGYVAKVRQKIKVATLSQYDRILVHDEANALALSRHRKKLVEATVAQLPGPGPIEFALQGATYKAHTHDAYALCIGAVRRNKNLEFAASVCAEGGIPLLIAGAPEPPEYGKELMAEFGASSSIELIYSFLSPAKFEALIANAQAVLVCYDGFGSSSGVVARTIAMGRPLVVADEPALVRQAGSYSNLLVYAKGSRAGLTESISTAFRMDLPVAPKASVDTRWLNYASDLARKLEF